MDQWNGQQRAFATKMFYKNNLVWKVRSWRRRTACRGEAHSFLRSSAQYFRKYYFVYKPKYLNHQHTF
jgi:hypothetical protein